MYVQHVMKALTLGFEPEKECIMTTRRQRIKSSRQQILEMQSSSQRENLKQSLSETIEVQRGILAKADSVLGCLVIAMEYGTDSIHPPYFPDVAQIARDLVQQSLQGLDAVNLPQTLRHKVKDEIQAGLLVAREALHLPSVAASLRSRRPERFGRVLRLHRRDYGRARLAADA
jgi:hypothetical protein